jgi:hypothetical protein
MITSMVRGRGDDDRGDDGMEAEDVNKVEVSGGKEG